MVKIRRSRPFFNTRKSPKSLPNTQKALAMFFCVFKFSVVSLCWPNQLLHLVSLQITNFLTLNWMRPIWRRFMDSIRDYVCVHLHGTKSQLIRIIHSKRNSLIYAKMLENRINYCSISIHYILQKEVNLPYFLFYLYQCSEILQFVFCKVFWKLLSTSSKSLLC